MFVAPVLVDAAYDASLRDLRDNWAPVAGLVVMAVGATTLAVALAARWLVPDMPWAVAVAMGAIVAPPDAAAATAVAAARLRAAELRRQSVIGDDAYRLLEEELDWAELSAAQR